jgi:beta-glucosidase
MSVESTIENVWTDRTRTAGERATELVRAMTLDEKMVLVQSHVEVHKEMAHPGRPFFEPPADSLRMAGYTFAIDRLGIPSMNESDAAAGIAQGPHPPAAGRAVTALPTPLLTAATWNPELAEQLGAVLGAEARASGIAVTLTGGVNLARDPRNGRNFEYAGEDPLLAGRIAGSSVRGIQSAGVISTLKHFAANAQETGRYYIDEVIEPGALRESDLLAFQIAIEDGAPGAIMTAYNKINGAFCSEDEWLLTQVLKRDWGYRGFVMGDWGSVKSTRQAALAGLDQQSGEETDTESYFGEPLKELAANDGAVAAALDDKVTRIVRSMIEVGIYDTPPQPGGAIDLDAHADIARSVAEEGIVLLKNADGLLPLAPNLSRVAIIGEHADIGVLSPGGSGQHMTTTSIRKRLVFAELEETPYMVYDPSSLAAAVASHVPGVEILFADGSDHHAAAALAAKADIAIVLGQRWNSEAIDDPDLHLPDGQDALITAIAAANPRTIVALNTGSAVATPWIDVIPALLAIWYPGIRGAEALADILFGTVNPSGRLPLTFPLSVDDLPRPVIPGSDLGLGFFIGLGTLPPDDFAASLNEGADVGYRWHQKQGNAVQFPFGFGLSYTSFDFTDLKIGPAQLDATVTVTNTGNRAGKQVVQVYATPPQHGATRRLVGFAKIDLTPGESRTFAVTLEPRSLARFDVDANTWKIDAGNYTFGVGSSSAEIHAQTMIALDARELPA